MPKEKIKKAGGVTEAQIPYLPVEIDADEIAEISMVDGVERIFLQDKATRERILDELKDKPDGRYVKSKKGDPEFQLQTPSKHSVIKHDNEYYMLAGRAGAGSFGVVKYAINMKTGELLAVKIMSEKHQMEKKGKADVHTEKSIKENAEDEFRQLVEAKRAKAKNIIDRTSPTKGKQKAILMELAPGVNLQTYIDDMEKQVKAGGKGLSPAQWLQLIKNVCIAVDELHKDKRLHRDIKPENFVIDPRTGKVTLIDLGLSANISDPNAEIIDHRMPGNQLTRAPESTNEHKYSIKSDIFGIGVAAGMMVDIIDYNDKEKLAFLLPASDEAVANNQLIKDKEALREIRFLARYMMMPNPKDRPELSKVVQHISDYQKKQEQAKVGIIDVDDYRQGNVSEKKAFIEKLKKLNFDEVVLIDSNPDGSANDHIKLVRELDKAEINTGNRVFRGESVEEIAASVQAKLKSETPERELTFSVVDIAEIKKASSIAAEAFNIEMNVNVADDSKASNDDRVKALLAVINDSRKVIPDENQATLETILQQNPDSADNVLAIITQRSRAFFTIASIYAAQNKNEDAVKYYQAAITALSSLGSQKEFDEPDLKQMIESNIDKANQSIQIITKKIKSGDEIKNKWTELQSMIESMDKMVKDPKKRLADKRVALETGWQSLERVKDQIVGVEVGAKVVDKRKNNLVRDLKDENELRNLAPGSDAKDKPVVNAAEEMRNLEQRLDKVSDRIDKLLTENQGDKAVVRLVSELGMLLSDRSDMNDFVLVRLQEFHDFIEKSNLPYHKYAQINDELQSIDKEVKLIRGAMILLPQEPRKEEADVLQGIDNAVKQQAVKKPVAVAKPVVNEAEKIAVPEAKDAELQRLDTALMSLTKELMRVKMNLKGKQWQPLSKNLDDMLAFLNRQDVSVKDKQAYISAHMDLVKRVINEIVPAQEPTAAPEKTAEQTQRDNDAGFVAAWEKVKKGLSDIDAMIQDPQKAAAAKQKFLQDSWASLVVYKDHMVTGQAQPEENIRPDNNDIRRGVEAAMRRRKDEELGGVSEQEEPGMMIHQIRGAQKLPGLLENIGSTLASISAREFDIQSVLMGRVNELRRKPDKTNADYLELLSKYNELGKLCLANNDPNGAKQFLEQGLAEISKIVPNNEKNTYALLFKPRDEQNIVTAEILFQKALAYEQLGLVSIKNKDIQGLRNSYKNAGMVFASFPKNGDELFNATENKQILERFGLIKSRMVAHINSLKSPQNNIKQQSGDKSVVMLKKSLALLEITANKYRGAGHNIPELQRLIGKTELMISIMSNADLSAEFKERALARFKIESNIRYVNSELADIKDAAFKNADLFNEAKIDLHTAMTNLQSMLAQKAKQEILSPVNTGNEIVKPYTPAALQNILKDIDKLDAIEEAKPAVVQNKADVVNLMLRDALRIMKSNTIQYEQRFKNVPMLKELIAATEKVATALASRDLSASEKEKILLSSKLEYYVKETVKELNAITDEPFRNGLWFDAVKGNLRAVNGEAMYQLAEQIRSEVPPAKIVKQIPPVKPLEPKPVEQKAVEKKAVAQKAVHDAPSIDIADNEDKKAYLRNLAKKTLASVSEESVSRLRQELASDANQTFLHKHPKTLNMMRDAFGQSTIILASMQRDVRDALGKFEQALADPIMQSVLSANSEIKTIFVNSYQSSIDRATQELSDVNRRLFAQSVDLDKTEEWRQQLSAKYKALDKTEQSRRDLKAEANDFNQVFSGDPTLEAQLKQLSALNNEISEKLKTFSLPTDAAKKPDYDTQLAKLIADRDALADALSKTNPQAAAIADKMKKLETEIKASNNSFFVERLRLISKNESTDQILMRRNKLVEFKDLSSTADASLKEQLKQLATLNDAIDVKLNTDSLPKDAKGKALYDAELASLFSQRTAITDEISKNNSVAAKIVRDVQNIEAKIMDKNNSFYNHTLNAPAVPSDTEKWGRLAAINSEISAKLKTASIPGDDNKKVVYETELVKLLADRDVLLAELGNSPATRAMIGANRIVIGKLEADIMVSNNHFYESGVKTYNLVSRFVEADILSVQDQATRIVRMERWVAIMQRCFEMGDFQLTNAILAAVKSIEFDKLKLTKQGLSESAKLIIEIISERSFRALDINASVNTMLTRGGNLIPYAPVLTMAIDKQGETQGKQDRLEIFTNIELARTQQKAVAAAPPSEDSPFQKAVFAQAQVNVDLHQKAMAAKTAQLEEYKKLKPLKDAEKAQMVTEAEPSVVQSNKLGNLVIPELLPWIQRERPLYEKWRAITDRLKAIPDELDEYKNDKVKDDALKQQISKCYENLLSNELPPNIGWRSRLLALDIVVNNKSAELAKLEADKDNKETQKIVAFIKAINIDDKVVHAVLKKMLTAYQEREKFDVEVKATPQPATNIEDRLSLTPKSKTQQPRLAQRQEEVVHPSLTSKDLDKIFADFEAYANKLSTNPSADTFRKGVTADILNKLIALRASLADGNVEQASRDIQTLLHAINGFQQDDRLNTHLHFDFFKKRIGDKKNTTLATYLSDLKDALQPVLQNIEPSKERKLTIEPAQNNGMASKKGP